jgi:hypothetical protein
MYGSLTRSPAVSARHKYQMAGTSRNLEGLMARWGFVEGRMGIGLRMLDAEKN